MTAATYQSVDAVGALTDASPHQVIDTMLATLIARVAQAKGHITRNEISAKAEKLSRALAIVEALTMSLDPERGGEIARNLSLLYEHMSLVLTRANLHNDVELLDQVADLLRQLKSGWEGIPVELRS
jgi:flagellar secretion chaperone FliS